MASEKLSSYEQQRLENIKRNADKLASLNIQSTINLLTALSKRQRTYRVSSVKKSKIDGPVVVRRSLRCRGIAAEEFPSKAPETRQSPRNSIYESGPIKMRDAFLSSGLDDRELVETILGVSQNWHISHAHTSNEVVENDDDFYCGSKALDSLKLGPKNIARVLRGRAVSMCFLPHKDRRIVVVGGDFGKVGFWNVDGDRTYVYQPHSAPVSGIVIQQFSMSKIFTCSHDGYIRLMDAERETFDLAYSGGHSIYTISQRPNDVKSLYFGEGQGKLNVWDEMAGKSSSLWSLHESRINSIDFNAYNTNIMATSSTDGTACIWDLRKVVVDKPEAISTVNHKGAVHSAYFSPSGSLLATTSTDDTVGLLSGANYDSVTMLCHNNSRTLPARGVWGWDDSYVFTGNMKGGVDVISTATNRCINTFLTPEMSAIPHLFEKHPGNVGMLAGATSVGLVYLWTSC